jgi:hypothetical protein
MPLSLVRRLIMRARPRSIAIAGFIVWSPVPNCRGSLGLCRLREYCEKIQMLPPIEFFMGMLAGGILGYLVAMMVNSGNEAGHR